MITLALDTTGAHCTAALVRDRNYLAYKSEKIGRGHAERLAPMVQEILKAEALSASQIDRIVVCTGPGSFTGLRVALSFAKGFALPRKIPVVGVSALQALAVQADPDMNQSVVSVIDVRRGELCWGAYQRGREVIAPHTQMTSEAIRDIRKIGYDRLVGDGSDIVGAASDITIISGPILGFFAQDLDPSLYPPLPLYSRGPDAKLPGGITPK